MKKVYKSLDELPLILKVKDVSEVLSLSEQCLYVRMGRSYLIPKEAILEYMEQNKSK